MTISKEIAHQKILNGNFPEIILDMFLGKKDPFDFEFRDPYYVFSKGSPNLSDNLIPHSKLALIPIFMMK